MPGQGTLSKVAYHGRGIAYGRPDQDVLTITDLNGNVKARLKFNGRFEADIEVAVEVRNESGAQLDAGNLVAKTGWDEATLRPLIANADADAAAGDEMAADFILRDAIANNANGVAYSTYREGALNTTGATEGDPVYLHTTAGGWVLARPTGADDVVQTVGRVAVVSATVGVIEFDLGILGGIEEIGTDNLQDLSVTQGKIALNAVGLAQLFGLAAGTMIAGDGSGDPASVLVTATNGLPLLGQTAAVPAFALLDPAAQVEGSMIFIKVELTDANAKALATGAGIEVIPTPGADKAIIVHRFTIMGDAALGAWVEPSAPDDLVLQYAGGADISGAIEAGVLVAADVAARVYGVLDTEVIPEANVGVNLFNTGSNWTGGNAGNSLDLVIFYSIVPTVAIS